MYAKIFATIVDSSLMEEPVEVRYTFIMLIAISDVRGDIIGTDRALARKVNMPLDDFVRCVERLMQPDPDSGNPEMEGRRIVRLEHGHGLRVVSYELYRDMRTAIDRREYMRDYMARKRAERKTRGRDAIEAAQGVLIREEREGPQL